MIGKDKKKANITLTFHFGRLVGFEPTTFGTTIRHSNQLSYNRRVFVGAKIQFFSIAQSLFQKKIFFKKIAIKRYNIKTIFIFL